MAYNRFKWSLQFPILVIDTETTGLIPFKHEVISIGYAMVDKSETGEYTITSSDEIRCHPKRPEDATEKALEINGYTLEKWDSLGAISVEEASEKITSLMEQYQTAYWRAGFDFPMLLGFISQNGTLEQMNKTRDANKILDIPCLLPPAHFGMALKNAVKLYGKPNENPHCAKDDAIAAANVLITLLKMREKEGLL